MTYLKAAVFGGRLLPSAAPDHDVNRDQRFLCEAMRNAPLERHLM